MARGGGRRTTLALALLTIGAILFALALARFRNTLATIAEMTSSRTHGPLAPGLFLTQGDELVVRMPGVRHRPVVARATARGAGAWRGRCGARRAC